MSELPTFVTSNMNPQSPSFWSKYKKIILIVAGILILGEAGWGAYTLTKPSNSDGALSNITNLIATPTPQATPKGTIGISGLKEVSQNEDLIVTLKTFTISPIDGADVFIKYDPKFLSIVIPSGKTTPIVTTNAFAEFPVNSFESNEGKIAFSGIIAPGSKGISGENNLGTLTFKALSKGKTTISIVKEKSSETSSHLVDSKTGGDILENVINLELNIK